MARKSKKKDGEAWMAALRAKWAKTITSAIGMSFDAPMPDAKKHVVRGVLPVLLENQEASLEDEPACDKPFIYDVICKAAVRMAAPHLLSVQPVTKPASLIFFMKYTCHDEAAAAATKELFEYGMKQEGGVTISIESKACAAITEPLKVPWNNEGMKDLIAVKDMDGLQALKELMAHNLANTLDRVIMKRLFEGLIAAGKVEELPAFAGREDKGIGIQIAAVKNKLHKTCLRLPNFIVGGINLVESLIKSDLKTPEGISYVGGAYGLSIWYDAAMPDKGGILGETPDGILIPGYVWAPYVPITFLARELPISEDDVAPRRRVAIRHSLNLLDPNKYLVLKLR